MNRTYLFIALSSVALSVILIIQVNWIFQAANIKEELFNEKANIVLSKTTEAISADQETCQKIGACVSPDGISKLEENVAHKIDSLFTHYMNFYNFHIDYSFIIAKPTTYSANASTNYVYNKHLERLANQQRFELKLSFSDKKQFIIAEMGSMFITSVILILVVLIMFWQTTLSLLKEKKISEHTTDFMNNMTHELKTPLTNIALAGKMILKNIALKKEDKLRHYSEIILEENEKLRLQVEQVLGMTGLERGEIPLQKTRLNVHELISGSLKCIRLQIEHKKGNLALHLDAQNPIITADKTHLTNALHNLIDNAIKYSKKTTEISIQTINKGQFLSIIITDKGIGIEKEYQKKIFDTFFRIPTGDVHNVKGFGLGLAYLKKIIELHQGSIELQSEKGKGARFTITLPNN
ncbi:sensor histidine kinase [Aureispira anguillae]|uniref:histidine kinase n=1 Tax=Aureispira anguillae TaxID=2864201 RepID=A0A916DXW9_9BACT|nr:HAMP domain-containing sensor histidine kinase [Aureispira anguillae]BDS15476.1 HAMP domain-containing histidine kinase [Aureispira anguillae]